MFTEGRKIAQACKTKQAQIKISGYPAKWLTQAFAIQRYALQNGIPVTRVLAQATNPLLGTTLASEVIWAVNMLGVFCGLRTAVFAELLQNYQLCEGNQAFCFLRAGMPDQTDQ